MGIRTLLEEGMRESDFLRDETVAMAGSTGDIM